MNKSEIQREHFNKITSQYLRGRSNKKHLIYKSLLWNHVIKELKKYLKKGQKLVVLDAMSGDAEASLKIAQHFPDSAIYAFDYSDMMVAMARKIVKNKKNIKISQLDILKLKDRNKYDLIVLIGGLHHVPHNVPLALKKLFASLKKGGLFLNLEPTHNNPIWRAARNHIYKHNDLFEEESEKAFEFSEYNELLKKAKFKIIYQIYPGLLGYILYYNPDAFPSLNIGPVIFAKFLGYLDLFLSKTIIGKYFSFATWTIAQKV